jgi:hypothetical protein
MIDETQQQNETTEGQVEASELSAALDCAVTDADTLYPYQKEILAMVSSIPAEAEIKTDLGLRRGPRVVAIKDGIRYGYSGNGKWVAI